MSFEKKIHKELEDKYGDGTIVDARFIVENKKNVISISPALDMAIGGIPEGTWTILSGPEKCGKTTTALQIAANAQSVYDKYVYYLNVEGRIKGDMNLLGVKDLNIDKMKIIQSVKGKILTAEDFLNEAIFVVKNHPGCVLIIDSASALCSEKEITEDITSSTRNNGPKLLASFCRQMGTIVPVQDTIVIIIQHLIANTSGYGAPFMEDGGNKIKYQVDTKLRCTKTEPYGSDKEKPVGQILHWKVLCSAMSSPGIKVQSYLRYGYGLDKENEILAIACDLGLVTKGGAWYTTAWLDEPYKLQGMENLRDFLIENPHHYNSLQEKIKGMI